LVKLQQLSMQQQGLASISQSATVLPAVEANSQTTSQELLIPNDVSKIQMQPKQTSSSASQSLKQSTSFSGKPSQIDALMLLLFLMSFHLGMVFT
ncbi:hypothetical protein XENOCAPTIV_017710, partial [Xenoophorus captivus]